MLIPSIKAKLFRSGVAFVVFFIFIPPFAFIGDRPSRVHGDRDEGFFASAGQWLSAVFHLFLPLVVALFTALSGVWHLALLPLTFVVIARRLTARHGYPYYFREMRVDLGEILQGRRARKIAIYGGATTLVSQAPYMLFGQSSAISSFITSAISLVAGVSFLLAWGTAVFLAVKVAGMHVTATKRDTAADAENLETVCKATGTSPAVWEGRTIENTGMELTVANPPESAVLNYDKVDGLLAKLAPHWEMDHSDYTVFALKAVTEETKQRRLEEAQSGGLIAGKIFEADDDIDAPVVHAGAGLITDDDLL